MKIINVTFREVNASLQRKKVENVGKHHHVVSLLTDLEKATTDKERKNIARHLVYFVCGYNIEAVLLESATEYSEILFREFRDHNIATYVVEQL